MLLSFAAPCVGLAAARPVTPPVASGGSEPPVCVEASHDRLLVQPSRDVCAPALTSTGAPRAPGFLPTRCRLPQSTLRLDVIGNRDLCITPSVQREKQ
jgi:hypothetical protein